MKKTFVFGANALSELMAFYLGHFGMPFDGLVLNKEFINSKEYHGLHLFSIEEMIEEYGNNGISVYLTIGYSKMNQSRESVYSWLKNRNIEVLSFTHPSSEIAENVIKGEGNIILEKSLCIQVVYHYIIIRF